MNVAAKLSARRMLALVFGLSLGFAAQAIELPATAAVPGGVVVLDLGDSRQPPPQARFTGTRTMVVEHNGRWQAVIGIPLTTKPGLHYLDLSRRSQPLDRVAFRIDPKEYQAQYITLKNKRMVEPSAADLTRIRADQERIRAALNHWSATPPATLYFALPAAGRFSSSFGLRRFFNRQPRRPHSGLDIAAPTGTIIKAPAPGQVIETGDYYFNGKTIFVDHGQGLVTMYCHLSRIDVIPGQRVETGDPIGAVGSTGRVTGPHLHWSVSLNATMVEPKLFIRAK